MFHGINNDTAWYVAGVMACGFITFYSLPDVVPFLVRLTMMVVVQAGVGTVLKSAEQKGNDEPPG